MISTKPPKRAANEILAIDVGNSSTKVAVWSNNDIRTTTTVRNHEFNAMTAVLEKNWQAMGHDKEIIACSVVPQRLEELRGVVTAVTGRDLLVVGEQLPSPIPVDIEQPESVGPDRLCCAAAAYHIESGACVVADLGTALTIDCIDPGGRFIGGAILPGLYTQARSLADYTASLPVAEVSLPEHVLGQHTREAIQSGITYGSIGAIKHLTEEYATHLGQWPVLILTGSDAPWIAKAARFVDKIVPLLCLRGVVLTYEQSFDS